MIKAIIVEDELAMSQLLKSILNKYFKEVEVLGIAEDIEPAVRLIQEQEPELVFMDIRLPSGESFEILDHFPNATFEVVFITAYTNYLQKAFDYFSFQYLTKPIDVEKLEKTIERFKQVRHPSFSPNKLIALKQLLDNKSQILTVPQMDGTHLVMIDDLVRLEADGNYTKLVMNDGKTCLSTRGIGTYQNMLEKHFFYRTHKSHLVNVKMIAKISNADGIALKNKETIPLAQRIKKPFMEFLEKIGI